MEIPEGCIEGPIDERNIPYEMVMGIEEVLPESYFINDGDLQDQNKEGWPYGCVYFANSQGNNIMNFLEGSEMRSSGSEMCEYAVENNMLDPKSGTYIINGPKVGTRMGYLDGYATVPTLYQIKHSISHKRPVQCGSNRISWGSANLENDWTVSEKDSGGHSIIINGYDDRTGRLRIKQSYEKWDNGHQWLRYEDLHLIYPTRFSLIDKADPIITNYKKMLKDAVTISAAKDFLDRGYTNGERPTELMTREEGWAMLERICLANNLK